MMESQCDFFIYFPAAPISRLSDAAEYATLPRRKHVYLGETVQFLLVLRWRGAAGRDDMSGTPPWKDLAGSLSALASVCPVRPGEPPDLRSSCSEDSEEAQPGETEAETADQRGRTPGNEQTFRPCDPLLSQRGSARGGTQHGREEAQSALVLEDQVIFCLSVSLDKLPVSTRKAKVIVTVWKQEEEKAELREHGYLTLLQLRSPAHTFRHDLSAFKTQVSTTIDVVPPPSVQCQQMTVSGKHLILLKVLNCSSLEEMRVRDVKILPNYNSSYLPMMPDGSVLIVDNVCHQSAEVTMASFCRIGSAASHLPCTLSALEEQSFLFQLQLQDKAKEESSEGLEVPLLAVLQWHSTALPCTRCISTCYSLPSIRLHRPQLVMMASCPRTVRPLEHFWVKYTLLNNLQDFLAVRLIWNSDVKRGDSQQDPSVGAVVCQSPLNNLGQCKKGSTLSFTVAFQILKSGLFELSQHMKLKLQFTASVSTPSVGSQSPLKHTPSSSRELQERHSLARSQSFPHQQPSMSRNFRSSAVMEFRPVTSPAGPVGRASYLSSDHNLISLEKIAKRECKVLVLEPVKDAHKRL